MLLYWHVRYACDRSHGQAARNANKGKYQSYLKTRRLDRLAAAPARDDAPDLGLQPPTPGEPSTDPPRAAHAVTATPPPKAAPSPNTRVVSNTRRSVRADFFLL
jgi:hypothetical protein